MAKKFLRNKYGLWTAVIYVSAILFFGFFSLADAFLASSAINGLFFTAILPAVFIALAINFFIGYGIGLLIEKIFRRLR